MPIELEKEAKETSERSIQKYCFENHDLVIGNMEANFFLEFFLKEIGPLVYNKAVTDTQQKIAERVMEIDSYVYEEEFTFWKKKNKK